MQIYHLEHNEIDKHRWDDAIQRSLNGNIYAYSWYLDSVCERWKALVNTDYSIIMPLTAKRKYGFNYLYRPLLSQQLGIFSSRDLKNEDVLDFFDSLPDKYRLIEISLNKTNPPTIPGFICSQHSSYELDLAPDYTAISSQYSQNNRRNARKALLPRRFRLPLVESSSRRSLRGEVPEGGGHEDRLSRHRHSRAAAHPGDGDVAGVGLREAPAGYRPPELVVNRHQYAPTVLANRLTATD